MVQYGLCILLREEVYVFPLLSCGGSRPAVDRLLPFPRLHRLHAAIDVNAELISAAFASPFRVPFRVNPPHTSSQLLLRAFFLSSGCGGMVITRVDDLRILHHHSSGIRSGGCRPCPDSSEGYWGLILSLFSWSCFFYLAEMYD